MQPYHAFFSHLIVFFSLFMLSFLIKNYSNRVQCLCALVNIINFFPQHHYYYGFIFKIGWDQRPKTERQQFMDTYSMYISNINGNNGQIKSIIIIILQTLCGCILYLCIDELPPNNTEWRHGVVTWPFEAWRRAVRSQWR